jgi:hypothetical protein
MDETTATPEAPASASTNDVGATGASGIDATQGQQQADQTQTQTAPESAQEEFSAGWSWDDQPEQESAIPESDDDLQGMLNDPKLDQERVPGLVEAIQKARAEARQNFKEAKQLREQVAKLDEFGGVEAVSGTMPLVNNLIHNPAEGSLQFLHALSTQAEPSYRQILDDLIKHESEYLVAGLQQSGKLPDVQQSAAVLTDEDWARIPKELQDVAKQVPVNQLIEWLDKGTDESLAFHLKTQKELGELKGAQRQQAEQQWRTAVQQAETSGAQAVDTLTDQYEKAHYAQLQKWQPFGPQANEQNQWIYRSILEGAHATLLGEKQWEQLYQDAVSKLQQAPLRRLRNDHLGADADEREARGMAARYNTRLGQVMKGMIQSLDSVFKDARAYRETQRQNVPNRTEIPGKSSTAASQNGAQRLTADGKLSDAYMDDLMSRHGIPKR